MAFLKKRMDYKWVILILCFFMEFICLGFCSSNVGLYTKAVTEALHIKRSVYSLTTSIRYAVQVLAALNFGALVNRFGAKKMACAGMLCLTASVAIRACATHVFHVYIGGVLWGLGIVFSGGTMAGTIIRRWFHKDVGRYTGIVMSANGIGGALAAQIISPLINNGEVFGYRKAYMLSAVITLAITILIMLFLHESPADDPESGNTGNKKGPKGVLWQGIPYETAKKKPYFYLAAILVFVTGIGLQSIGSITLVYMADVGMTPAFIATTATVHSLCLTLSKVFVGSTYDKRGLQITLLCCQITAMLSYIMFAILTNSAAGPVIAMIAVVLESLAIPMETVIIPLLSNDLFGSASYNKVLGIFMAMNSLGLCLGSPLGDLCFDILGTYKPCFWFFAILMAVVAMSYHFVIRAAYREKTAILAETNSSAL